MKKFIAFLSAAVLCWTAAAQSWEEALLFSGTEYGGTARSIGMGNALTAVGGDPGSITLNPAGSAVAAYSQFTLTPGLTLSVGSAVGDARGYGDVVRDNYTRATLPNLAFVLNRNTGRRSGWKRTSVGFVLNATDNYTRRFNASGVNESTSYAASLATSADGYSPEVLADGDWFYSGSDPARRPEWVDRVALLSDMISTSASLPANRYLGVSEVLGMQDGTLVPMLPYPLRQHYGAQASGGKHDMVFNFAADYADILYLGLNMGVTLIDYGFAEYWQEMPEDPDFFPPIEYEGGVRAVWESLRMRRNYRLRGSGVYLKAGVLWRPVAGLRIGAAVQTPTFTDMAARNAFSGEVHFSGRNSTSCTSPEDQWAYSLVTPARYSVGAAYSFGSFAVLSADYEWVNYRSARFDTATGDYGDLPAYMSDANLDIRDALGGAHHFRAGVELKPLPALSLRAGFNYTGGAQRNFLEYYLDSAGYTQVELTPLSAGERAAQARYGVSAGIGYAAGAFFADAAVRFRTAPKEYVTPYFYYGYDTDYTDKFIDADVDVPEIEARYRFFDAVLTLGWRF